MEGKVRKVNRHTRKKYERRARRKNRRHPIEHVIEIIVLIIILIIIVSATMHNCAKKQNLNATEETTNTQEESTTEQNIIEDSTEYSTEVDTTEEETSTEQEKTTEPVKETEEEIPTTSSVWEDPFEKVNSLVDNSEKENIDTIIKDWTAARYFFNLMMGSLDMVLGQSSITVLTEEMNGLQRNYLMSNVILEPDNIITEGTFTDKLTVYQTLMTTIKDNLKSGISFSKRFVANDYIGYEAPFQNALGLVPASYEEMADNLKHLEITLNILPEHIEPTEDLVAYVETLHDYGIAAGMHFPSPGMEYVTWKELKEVYQPIFDAGLDYIVMSERVFPFLTGNEPATFSKQFIQMLRNEFGFDGVIVTADMSSEEIQGYIAEEQIEEPNVYAFLQGCDMIHETQHFVLRYTRLNQLYEDGTITDAKLKASIGRVAEKAYLYSCGQ